MTENPSITTPSQDRENIREFVKSVKDAISRKRELDTLTVSTRIDRLFTKIEE